MIKTKWPASDVDTLVTLWNEGMSTQQIAAEMDKSRDSIKMFVQRHKKALGLHPRLNVTGRPKSERPEFDRQWYGAVPCGHWTITKPWKKVL